MRLALCLSALVLIASPIHAQEADIASVPTVAPTLSAAEKRSDQLDRLMAQLHQVKDGSQAAGVEQQIWALWMTSDSPTAEVLLQQATTAMGDGANDDALKILNRVIGAYPDFAEAWNKRATLYFVMERYDDSLADIDKVLDLEPRHFGALSGRGMILQKQKRYSAAVEAFRAALAINPSLSTAEESIKAIEKIEQPI